MRDNRRMTHRDVVYARRSNKKDRASEQSSSVTEQLDGSREYSDRTGGRVVAEFSDDGKSGLLGPSGRKGLAQALRLLETGDADRLIMKWKSRLSRDELDRALILRDLEKWGIEWHAWADGGLVDRKSFSGYTKDKADEMIDTGFSIRVGENWRRVHQRRLDAGLPKSSPKYFGYDKIDGGSYVVNESQAVAVREVYRRYAQGVEGFTQLVRWLNAEGHTTTSGAAWTVRTLSRFMESGFPAGFISREEELRTLRGAHEPIITEPEWLAYRAHRDRQATRGKKSSGASEKWWLSGLVRCGECNGSTYVDSYTNEKRGSVCCSNRRANPDACVGTSILRKTVENAVGLWLGGHLDALESLVSDVQDDSVSNAVVAYDAAVLARDRVRDAMADLEVRMSLGKVDASVYRIAQERLATQLRDAEEDVVGMATNIATPSPDPSLLRGAADRGWSTDERVALRGVLDRVLVTRDGLTIVPVAGESVTRSRRDLAPSCRVFGCGLTHYTKGLCKSHAMRAKSAGVFDALAEAVADDERTVTGEDVELVLASR